MAKHISLGILVFGCLVASNAQAQNAEEKAADPLDGQPNVRIEYYDVSGTDEASINASFQAGAPRHPDGRLALANTTYRFRLTAAPANQGAGCTLSNINIQLEATVRLPRLTNEALVPERIRVLWKPFIAGLRLHEAGHVAIENEGLNDIKAAMSGSKCDQLKSTMDAATSRIDLLQDAYDRQTSDGATQGASLHL
jgi:predicted secreted Zn-dependent protease